MVDGVKKKRKKCSSSLIGEDRISALPDCLIHHILSFLKMRVVIRTCVLARRWRYLWTSVPVMDFGTWGSDDPTIIDRSLILYEGRKIRRFRVDVVHQDDLCCTYSWIRFAARHDVEELDIEFCEDGFSMDDDPFKLPSCVFDRGALRVLRLGFCVINLPASFYCRSLTTLHLFCVKSPYLDISGFPVLENLIMEACQNDLSIYAPNQKFRCLKMLDDSEWDGTYGDLTLDAPYLLFIEVTGNTRKSYNFKNSSSIKSASLEFFDVFDFEFDSLVELLKHLSHAKTLKLCKSCIEILGYRERDNLETPRLSSTYLQLETNLKKSELLGIVSLLRSSHCLESLTINVNDLDSIKRISDLFDETKSWELLALALSADLQLKTVTIRLRCELEPSLNIDKFLENWAGGIKLVKLLLKGCKMLDKLIISTVEIPSCSAKPELLLSLAKKLKLFPRASASAEIYFS